MKNKVVLVEDDPDLAENYSETLESLGYQVIGCFDNSLATLEFLAGHRPDVALIDIRIKGEQDGISLARVIERYYTFPVIFITAYTDDRTLEHAYQTTPANYLVKPVSRETFKTALFLVFNSRSSVRVRPESKRVMLRSRGYIVYLYADEIVYLKADGLYTVICTHANEKYTERCLLKEFMDKLPPDQFLRVHKSYIVNLNYVEAFNSKEIEVNQQIIPIRRGLFGYFKNRFGEQGETGS
jgi:two-component system response regulator LytT